MSAFILSLSPQDLPLIPSFFQICMYYLVMRGLDTIEDDMTIHDEKKQPILRKFHELTVTPGWNFTENGLDEKDRQLLLEYHIVVEEVNRLAPQYAPPSQSLLS